MEALSALDAEMVPVVLRSLPGRLRVKGHRSPSETPLSFRATLNGTSGSTLAGSSMG